MAFFEHQGDGGGAGGGEVTRNVKAATKGALPASTYNNGNAGKGATLTADANGALPAIDGVTVVACQMILVKNQANGAHNGVYHVENAGDAGNPWMLKRATWNDESTEFEIVVNVGAGSQAGEWWIGQTLGDDPDGLVIPGPTVGTDVITPSPWPPKKRNGQKVFFAQAGSTGDVAGTYDNGPIDDGQGATLTGAAPGALAAQDGVALATGDLVLLLAQTNGEENGLYFIDEIGDGSNPFVLRRLHGVETSFQLDGALVYLMGGATLIGRHYRQSTAAPVVGTDPLVWTQFGAGGAGAGLGSNGTAFIPVWVDQSNTNGGVNAFVDGNLNIREGTLTGGVDRYVAGWLTVPDEWDGGDVDIVMRWRLGSPGNNGQTAQFRLAWGLVDPGAELVEHAASPQDASHVVPAGDLGTEIQETIITIPGATLVAGETFAIMFGRWAGTIAGDTVAGSVHPHSVVASVGLA